MSKEFALKCKSNGTVSLKKQFVTVGEGAGYDIGFDASKDRILFTLELTSQGYRLILGQARVNLNGKRLSESRVLRDCDRIEFDNYQAVFFETDPQTNESAKSSDIKVLEILESLVRGLGDNQSVEKVLSNALAAIANVAGAEEAYLISEIELGIRTEWKLLATFGEAKASLKRKDLISSTILNQAIKTGEPLHIESLIGHPMALEASLIGARLFSIACLPLRIGDYTFGAVYLSTSTPGKSIHPEVLKQLSIVSTQVALFLASQTELMRIQKENEMLKDSKEENSSFVFTSESMRDLHSRIRKLAASELNLLVIGETGTGKELIAKEIHNSSPRALGPFIVVNCAAIPPTLVESVLFGHTKGAYTGATQIGPVNLFKLMAEQSFWTKLVSFR